jgi:trehalose synthase
MAMLREVVVEAAPAGQLAPLLGEERAAKFDALAQAARERLAGRTVVNLNSTASGGGVAEMLQTLLAHARGVGIDARWFVFEGNPPFFEVTKRIHNNLYGAPGDHGELDGEARQIYEGTLEDNATEFRGLLRPGDIALIHDPQPAGLVAAARRAGASVVWRCHVGIDEQSEYSQGAWDFLRPYLTDADAYVFTRRAFAPSWAADDRLHVIAPSIDPFSSKNTVLTDIEVLAVLRHTGLVDGEADATVQFTRRDGTRGEVIRHADVVRVGGPPSAETPLVVQVSRWDRMKDMAGVMAAFAEHIYGTSDAHLMLVGPAVTGVTDDPEGAQVFEECRLAWEALPLPTRGRVHLVCLPMLDPDENATIVNALQRHAAVVAQKSVAEGFGLTVVEAMWKGRPVVASAIGGINDQIVDEEHGLLIEDPLDLGQFGRATRRLLEEPDLAARLGTNARARAHAEFLPDRHLEQWASLLGNLPIVT